MSFDPKEYPHQCEVCGSAAYRGFASTQCTNTKCQHYDERLRSDFSRELEYVHKAFQDILNNSFVSKSTPEELDKLAKRSWPGGTFSDPQGYRSDWYHAWTYLPLAIPKPFYIMLDNLK